MAAGGVATAAALSCLCNPCVVYHMLIVRACTVGARFEGRGLRVDPPAVDADSVTDTK